jgi:hypothetical protein
MESKMIRTLVVACSMIVLSLAVAEIASAQTGQGNLPNYLFSQYSTQGGASSAHAGMYPAPHPVPRHVGSSYYTYQPLMPHEMMYTHSRNYYNYYNDSSYYGGGGSLNKTSVKWQNGCAGIAPLPMSGQLMQKLHYGVAKRAYCIGGNCSGGGGGLGLGGGLGGKLRGGCLGGNCGGGEVYSGDSYGGEVIGDSVGCSTCGG